MSNDSENHPDIPTLVDTNVDALKQLQTEKKQHMRWDYRFVDPIVEMLGSMSFLWLNLAMFTVWILINVGVFSFVDAFDPYPFEFLTLTVSLEAIVLSVVVLIGQNELQKDSDERAELDLHINLLSEREATAILKKLVRLEEHMGIKVEESERLLVEELLVPTNPVNIVQKIDNSISSIKKK